jgi:hypothetical protein
MDNYQIVLDVWEGQLEMDEAAFITAGVAGMVIRLNHIKGGHHMDEAFQKQWDESAAFLRWPYFVYNPWVDGEANYNWLVAHAPVCTAMSVDIEVKYADYSSHMYASQVARFLALAKNRWKVNIYTGEWFLPTLDYWPADMDYWWAQYPKSVYPSERKDLTWEQLRALIQALNWPPANAGSCPGPVKLWQCSGDRLLLPGSIRALDINIWPGDLASLAQWVGISVPYVPHQPINIPVIPVTTKYRVATFALNIRETPKINGVNGKWLAVRKSGDILDVIKIENGWAQLFPVGWCNAAYLQKV